VLPGAGKGGSLTKPGVPVASLLDITPSFNKNKMLGPLL
jgi:hypothetical protein